MPAPQPTIYLRNTFRLKPGREMQFLAGKENLLRRAPWILVAGWGEWPLLLNERPAEASFVMTQVWKLPDWNSLYDSIYAFSETSWYRALGDSLLSEDQELLVGVTSGYRESGRPAWKSDTRPGYRYLYEESLPLPGKTHAYLRDANWFAAQVGSKGVGWELAWAASQITAHPSVICMLWRVPDDDRVASTLSTLANQNGNGGRYQQMAQSLAKSSREIFYPIYTERLDDRIRQHEAAPIVMT
jgi:hypothetical protein